MMMTTKTMQAARLLAGARAFSGSDNARIASVLRFGNRTSNCNPAITAPTFAPRSAAAATTRPFAVASATTAAAAAGGNATNNNNAPSRRRNLALGLAGGLALAGLHSATGSQTDFFDYRFRVANKSAEDLATFYGGEEFMELYSVFPFVGTLMMRNGTFDEDGNFFTTGIPGTLRVSMVFSDDNNEETGDIEWFNKRERFRDMCFGWTCWDMVVNFGFRTSEDGTIEVYHYGEYFHGNVPLISQIVMLVFKTHARWLAWATEHHINHYAFTAETEEEEELEEESRKNMPLFLLKHYAWTDLMAMLFGVKEDNIEEDKSSFLVRKSTADKDADDTNNKIQARKTGLLPIQRDATKIQISQDIATDRMATRGMLARSSTQTADDVKALLTRNYTIRKDGSTMKGNAYGVATEAARLRHLTRAATRREGKFVVDPGNSSSVESAESTQMKPSTNSANDNKHSLRRQPSSALGAS